MIDDKNIQKALDWLVENATPAAQARANRIYCEEFRKSVKADLMAQKPEESIGAQERFAYSHPTCKQHLLALKQAVEEDERMRWLMVAAEAKIEAWRTYQANARAQGRI